MQDQPLVSIITPTYNHEQFIGQCIESVLAQTYTNWEQIIINDGSTDKTSEVIKTYNDRRIRYIYQENVGIWKLNETYNKALALANGEIIAVLEGDDFWPPDKLDVQAPYFVNSNVVLTFGKVNETNTNGCAIATHPRNWNWFPQKRSDVIEKLILNDFISACTAMCRKSTLYEIGGSLVGLLCALTRTDMEWMVKLFHKLTLSNVKYNPDIRLQNQKQESII